MDSRLFRAIHEDARMSLKRSGLEVLIPGDQWKFLGLFSHDPTPVHEFIARHAMGLRTFFDPDEEGWPRKPVVVLRHHFETMFVAIYLSRLTFCPDSRSFALRMIDTRGAVCDFKIFPGGEVILWSRA